MESKKSFEENLKAVDEIISKLEEGKLSLNDSIKSYEKAMKLLKVSSDILSEAEGKVLKVIENNNGDIELEEA